MKRFVKDNPEVGILIGALIIFFVLYFSGILHAAEIVYYDDDSDTIVIREWSCLRWNVDPDTLKFTQSCDISIYCIDGVYDTVTYVRKEAEPTDETPEITWGGVAMTLIPADSDSYWADTLIDSDIVANLDSMIAGSCIRIPHDAPTYYFVDTVITCSEDTYWVGTWELYCDTTYKTRFVYEVE